MSTSSRHCCQPRPILQFVPGPQKAASRTVNAMTATLPFSHYVSVVTKARRSINLPMVFMNKTKITVNGDTYDCNVDPIHIPTIERILCGTTEADVTVDILPVPSRPLWLVLIVRIIRGYRRRISPLLGSRCVFEPSCSRYAELAFRNKGFLRGSVLSVHRLIRCRPGKGGVDWP